MGSTSEEIAAGVEAVRARSRRGRQERLQRCRIVVAPESIEQEQPRREPRLSVRRPAGNDKGAGRERRAPLV